MRKVSVTLEDGLVKQARGRAGAGGLSRYLNDALRLHLQRDRLSEYLDELDEEFGPVPPEIIKEVERRWRAGDEQIRRATRGR